MGDTVAQEGRSQAFPGTGSRKETGCHAGGGGCDALADDLLCDFDQFDLIWNRRREKLRVPYILELKKNIR